MPESLFHRVVRLTEELNSLKTKLRSLEKNTDYKPLPSYSKVGSLSDRAQINPMDVAIGLGKGIGGNIFWNDAEVQRPPFGTQPTEPTIGFNKHSHSEFSGGALEANTLEIVEYKTNEAGKIINNNGIVNSHCQQFWNPKPSIALEQNSNKEDVEKKGKLDLVFSPDKGKWGVSALEIDVEHCYLVKRNVDGTIALDSNGNEMKSPLLVSTPAGDGETEEQRINRENDDLNRSMIAWDKNVNGGVGAWRFYATFAPAPETPEV